jgi:hypothetical protein
MPLVLLVCLRNFLYSCFHCFLFTLHLRTFITPSLLYDSSNISSYLLTRMNDPEESQLVKAPLVNQSPRRHAYVPNTKGFWTDLALARCAYRSSSVILTSAAMFLAPLMWLLQIEIRAACLHVMNWRTPNNIERPRTTWDHMLVDLNWLREDYKCDVERKKIYLREVVKPCIHAARQRLQRIHFRHDDGSWNQMLGCVPAVPEWAREEYLAQQVLPQDPGPEPSSDREGAAELGPTSASSKMPTTGEKRKAETPASFSRSKRLRGTTAYAATEDSEVPK